MARYWVIAPHRYSRKPDVFEKFWKYDLENNVISIGWGSEFGDVSKFSKSTLEKRLRRSNYRGSHKTFVFNKIWDFYHNIKKGDIVIARRGCKIIAAIGTVTQTAYHSEEAGEKQSGDPERCFPNFIGVKWHDSPRDLKFKKSIFIQHTIDKISEDKLKSLLGRKFLGSLQVIRKRIARKSEGFIDVVPAPEVRPPRRSPREGHPVNGPDDIKYPEREPGVPRTSEDQIHSALLLDERTTEHQKVVRKLFNALRNVTDIRRSKDAFDVLATSQKEDLLLLFEVKTIRKDSSAQAMKAVGQLLFYEFFDVIPKADGKRIVKVAVFDNEPGDKIRSFLNHNGVYCIAFLKGKISVPNELRDYF